MNRKKGTMEKTTGPNLAKLTKQFFIVGLIFAVAGLYLWYTRLHMNDERRFWVAIENSMSVPSVTRTIENGGSGNRVVQQQQFLFSPNMVSASRVAFDQNSPTEITSVVTEGISYVDAQYSRYESFVTNQQTADGTPINLDSLLGKWEESIAEDDAKEEARLAYLSEFVTLVIFGNFDSDYKRSVIQQMKDQDVYGFGPGSIAQEEDEDGETIIRYNLSVKLKPFVELLNSSFVHAGFGEFPPLDPAGYPDDSPPLPVQISVNKRQNAVVGVTYGTRLEMYSGHGILKDIERPVAEFKAGELEAKVSENLQGAF